MDLCAVDCCWVAELAEYTCRATRPVGVVVHRIEVSQEDKGFGDTPIEVARFFREHPVGRNATGGKMPYPILIDAEGIVTQTVPLGLVTPHARAYNATTIGVGCIGDFRTRAPAAAQHAALVRVCASLLDEHELEARALYGHDELAGGSADPNKECPGAFLSMPALRELVAVELSRRERPRPRFTVQLA